MCITPVDRNRYSSDATGGVKACVVKRDLSAPPTSVASERLYSSASHVFTDRRNRLGPKKADMLLFIKHNLPLISFKY